MAAIGQAQAGAALTVELIRAANLSAGSRVVVVGAGTGQMFEFFDPALFRPFQLICTDLNAMFLARLRKRLAGYGLPALLIVDDIERTALGGAPDLLLATLVFEHIDWPKGVEQITALGPALAESPSRRTHPA
jgi:hypothetical protein